jgi:hypothetical protein
MNAIKDVVYNQTKRIEKMQARMDVMETALKYYADRSHIKAGERMGADDVRIIDEYGTEHYVEDGTKAAEALGK